MERVVDVGRCNGAGCNVIGKWGVWEGVSRGVVEYGRLARVLGGWKLSECLGFGACFFLVGCTVIALGGPFYQDFKTRGKEGADVLVDYFAINRMLHKVYLINLGLVILCVVMARFFYGRGY